MQRSCLPFTLGLSAVLLLAIFALSCSRGGGPETGDEDSGPPAAQLPAANELQGERESSATETIDSDNLYDSSSEVSINGGEITTQSSDQSASWFILRAGGFMGGERPQQLDLNLTGQRPVWIALANYGQMRWEFRRLDDAGEDTGIALSADHLDENGNLFLGIIAEPGKSLTFNSGNISTSEVALDLPAVPGVETAEQPGAADRLPADENFHEVLDSNLQVSGSQSEWSTKQVHILPDYQGAVERIEITASFNGPGPWKAGLANYRTESWQTAEFDSGGTKTFEPRPLSSYRSFDATPEDNMTHLVFAAPPGTTLTVTSIRVRQDRVHEQVPPGFTANRFADLNAPRGMWTDPQTGVTYVADRGADRVVALHDDNGDGRVQSGEMSTVLDRSLASLHGVTVHRDQQNTPYLYAAEQDAVWRVELSSDGRSTAGSPEQWVTGLPTGGHSARSFRFDDSGNAYLGVGSAGNVTTQQDRAAIYRVPAGSSQKEVWVNGLRNPTALLIEGDDLLTFSIERDLLGDDQPVEPLYRIPLDTPAGQRHYGYPWWMWSEDRQDFVRDDRVTSSPTPSDPADIPGPPEATIGAHQTPLGMVHAADTGFPAPWDSGIFVAAHGSWNATTKVGYRVYRITETGETEAFTGEFLTKDPALPDAQNGGWFRPVGVAPAADGSLLITGDATSGPVGEHGFTGVMRISHTGGDSLNTGQ